MSNPSGPIGVVHSTPYKPSYTVTEKRIMALLGDGLPKPSREIWRCLEDEMASMDAMRKHLSRIREKLKPLNHGIICEIYNRHVHYRYVILLSQPITESATS